MKKDISCIQDIYGFHTFSGFIHKFVIKCDRNAVLELLESNRDINKIYIADGEKHGSIHRIIALARERKVILKVKNQRNVNR